ncbi:MAG: tRNA (adenosine(37)-N6)-threonylcarbamoyltransferase complex ATPase subunit type 1 TsaE [Myxococcaceae bacterium]|nr:tRNA (adenosine(37)-N6)-threonylcarbamoyltransferase complex ATPase subunit type 1 TsaE [Myxococcaceae bacterium]MCI0672289.1 tRNA (adenosine(37)-N6)-threonylcarbamoyltransferase complex ATPase subunit type 1 TsaE [Myxococcaceae bacterium]
MAAVTSTSPEMTYRMGVRLGQLLQPGDFVGLVGELGAGKTHFVRGVAEGAGVPSDVVASPTYSIVTTYPGRIPLHHADLYRLEDHDELYATGFFDLLDGEGAVLVEWLDKVPSAAPREYLRITLSPVDEVTRELEVEPVGERAAALAAAWLAG